MVQKRSGMNPKDERESAVVREFRSSGFVARSAETEAQKAAQRDGWDRSQNLAVKDDDVQLQIYNQYMTKSNTTSEGQTSRLGLGAGGALSCGGGGGLHRPMAFVAAGGAPASLGSGSTRTPTPSTGYQTASPAFYPGGAGWAPTLPVQWSSGVDPASGRPYYINMSTGVSQWTPPFPAPAPPPPAVPDALPAGWHAVPDPSTGHTYYANPSTGMSSWTRPVVQAPAAPAPCLPPDAPPLPPDSPPLHPDADPLPPDPPPHTPDTPPLPPDTPAGHAGQAQGPCVRVRGLPGSMSDADLRDIFSACGRVTAVAMERGAYSAGADVPKSATVTLDSVGSAQAAVRQLHGSKLRGSRLEVAMVQLVGRSEAGAGSGRGAAAAARAMARPY